MYTKALATAAILATKMNVADVEQFVAGVVYGLVRQDDLTKI